MYVSFIVLTFGFYLFKQATCTYLPSCCLQSCPSTGILNGCSNCFSCSSPNLLPLCPSEAQTPPSIDPVSLSLALQAQKQCIREEKLNFGPNKLPIDGRYFKFPMCILEDGLHTLNKQIVELKSCCPSKSISEEAAESYLDDDCFDSEMCNRPFLSYSDLGYVAETPKCPVFVPGVPPASSYPQGQVIYNGPVPCQQFPTCQHTSCQTSRSKGADKYQPGGLYLTQTGCRNTLCSPDCSCQNSQFPYEFCC